MWDSQLKMHLNGETEKFLEHYQASREKYAEIWNYYKSKMPTCIQECSGAGNEYAKLPDRDGPQGIYWIGRDPEIFIVGREHYGWTDEECTWPEDIDSICYNPLLFSFYTIASMGQYWGIIKDVIEEIYENRGYSWDEKLQKVAFSNACKCRSTNRSYQRILHENCFKQGYLSKEILLVNAKVNVLFTKTYKLIDRLFNSETEVLNDHGDFAVRKYGSQIIIECAHPGRESHDWRDELKKIIKNYM